MWRSGRSGQFVSASVCVLRSPFVDSAITNRLFNSKKGWRFSGQNEKGNNGL